jgi:Zn-dependent M28 family amino/carboxypeptidase
MRTIARRSAWLVVAVMLAAAVPAAAQVKGAAAIRADDMKIHMQILGSNEFKGRNMPSVELEIASRYIALTAQRIGLKPLMAGGSYYQEMPLDITRVSESTSHIAVTTAGSTITLHTPAAFAVRGRTALPGSASGGLVFLGLGANAPALGWDDFAGLDLKGKVVVILDAQLPASHALRQTENRTALAQRATLARQKGAVAILTIIPREREATLAKNGLAFLNMDRGRALDIETGTAPSPPATAMPAAGTPPPTAPAVQAPPPAASAMFAIDLRHDAAAALLGISRPDLDQMFDRIGQGQRVPSRELAARTVDIAVNMDARKGAARNVVAWIEGTDPVLKGEYVVLGSHHDGVGYREDAVFPGADDNISGVVAMFSIGRALMIERPKRSVIFVWHTGEEKGLLGAYYFVQHSPVPVEKISANLNLDMLCRNDPTSIYLIGSNKVSMELDKAINDVNDRFTKMTLDYKYQEPSHPDRFFFRSDQYPYIRYGVPGVWFFCGTTDDYHQPTDTEDRADYVKMEKVTKLVYYTTMEVGNKPAMLKLDVDPRITTRGAHNMKINWQAQRPPTRP